MWQRAIAALGLAAVGCHEPAPVLTAKYGIAAPLSGASTSAPMTRTGGVSLGGLGTGTGFQTGLTWDANVRGGEVTGGGFGVSLLGAMTPVSRDSPFVVVRPGVDVIGATSVASQREPCPRVAGIDCHDAVSVDFFSPRLEVDVAYPLGGHGLAAFLGVSAQYVWRTEGLGRDYPSVAMVGFVFGFGFMNPRVRAEDNWLSPILGRRLR